MQFNHTTLEQDIKRLSEAVTEKKNLPEYKTTAYRELIKQTIQPLVKKVDYTAAAAPSPQTDDSHGSVLPAYLEEASPEVKLQVEKLIDSVFHEGLSKAVAKAESAGSFILDAFHDALADKLYDELKKRKLI